MRRFRGYQLIFGFLVATAFCAIAQYNSAQSQPQQPVSNQSNEAATSKNVEDRLAAYTLWLALFTAVLAGSTIGLWLVTWRSGIRQSRDMERATRVAADATNAAIASNQIAVTNSQQQLRAYVTARDLRLVLHRHPASMGAIGPIEGRVHTYGLTAILKNGGQTPATNVTVNISCHQLRNDDLPAFDFPDSSLFGHGLIGPQGEMDTPIIRVSAAELEPIAADSQWYLWGWVEYDDIFTGTSRHRTEFCFQIDRVRLPVTNELWIGFKPYSRFNAADDTCLRPIHPHTNKSGSG